MHKEYYKTQLSDRRIYFKRNALQFGQAPVGSLTRMKIELCNPSDKAITCSINDPALPFVILHSEVTINPRAYVRLPVRFVPVVVRSHFGSELMVDVQEDNSTYSISINLIGASYQQVDEP